MAPADKKIDPGWIKSLFERGERARYQGDEVKYIGMPVGGICCGQIYLGGDGRLWNWDIFNQITNSGGDGYRYLNPLNPDEFRTVQQGFALQIKSADGDRVIPLDATAFPDVSFEGAYPMATIRYQDSALPLAVTLEAFSPFIPLNLDDSSIPVVIFHFTVTNTSDRVVKATLAGTLQNAVGLRTMPKAERINRILDEEGHTFLQCSIDFVNGDNDENLEVDVAPAERSDFGTMGLALLGEPAEFRPETVSAKTIPGSSADVQSASLDFPVGALGREFTLQPGETIRVTFLIAWHFPNLTLEKNENLVGRHYAIRFGSAGDVARYVAREWDRLHTQTRLWRDTWYDSTLPYWFLDRTFANTSILSTSTPYRLKDGRFYGWEGVGSCKGTCTHVWHYAQAVARLFPELERDTRERVDLGVAFDADSGVIGFRAEFDRELAVDGQAGTILRFYREHQMSVDDAFLRRNWLRIKQSFEPLFRLDAEEDGILEGAQMNTLDSPWFGKIGWLSGLYVAAVKAGQQMAVEMNDEAFAARCQRIAEAGFHNIPGQLFNGDYFFNIVDPNQLHHVNSGTGCEIDQVLGQSWAFQVGLPRVLPQKECRSALQSLWHYNFFSDIGPWREANKPGRWYAAAGDMGLVMCTFPRPDWDFQKAGGNIPNSYAYYFNECMSGFEHQVAGHMLNEGLVTEGLAVTRAIHDRYHPSKRNPYNEIECGSHYARAMASYGTFLAATGFHYHGPRQMLGFAPKVHQEKFRAAFTTAEEWGTYDQKVEDGSFIVQIALKYGVLSLRSLSVKLPDTGSAEVTVRADDAILTASAAEVEGMLVITFPSTILLRAGQNLEVSVT